MAYHNSVLSQLLKLLPRHEFETQANRYDGKRRGHDPNHGSFVCVSVAGLFKVPIKNQQISAANITIVTTESVCQTILDRSLATT